MAKLLLNPLSASYTFAEPAQLLYQPLPGGMPRQRLDMVGGMSRLISVTYVCNASEYEYLIRFIRQNIADDAALIQIDLLITDSVLIEYNAYIVPDTFSLDSIDGYTFTCSMQVMAIPTNTESTTWPSGWTSSVFQLPPDKSSYSIKYGSESVSVQHDGNVPKSRRSYFNASRLASFRWNCDPDDFITFFEAYRYWVFSGGEPFYMDLFMDKSVLTRHRCTFVPGSVRLTTHQGHLHVVEAELEIESDPWPYSFTPHEATSTTIVPTPWDPFSSTGGSNFTFSEGNFLVTAVDGSGIVFNETHWLGGARYAEFVVPTAFSFSHTVGLKSSSGDTNNQIGLRFDGYITVDDIAPGPSVSTTDGSIFMVAIAADRTVWVGADGVWIGNPVLGTGGTVLAAGTIDLMFFVNSAEGTFAARTRTTAGEFTYTPPTGFDPWIS